MAIGFSVSNSYIILETITHVVDIVPLRSTDHIHAKIVSDSK
jgi:hypothetical protein